jgi:hypothetical protein
MAAIQDWTSLFLPEGAHEGRAVDIEIEDDEILVEVTGDMLVALPEADDPDDEVTEPLRELCSEEVERDWPRSWEELLQALQCLSRHGEAAESMATFGLGDVRGCEEVAAAIAATWEQLRFLEPMLELGRQGEFTGHLHDLRRCADLLETHQPPPHRADMLERWEQARSALRRALPAQPAPVVPREELLRRFSQQGRGRTQVTVSALSD